MKMEGKNISDLIGSTNKKETTKVPSKAPVGSYPDGRCQYEAVAAKTDLKKVSGPKNDAKGYTAKAK